MDLLQKRKRNCIDWDNFDIYVKKHLPSQRQNAIISSFKSLGYCGEKKRAVFCRETKALLISETISIRTGYAVLFF
jgi:hypothetical protein